MKHKRSEEQTFEISIRVKNGKKFFFQKIGVCAKEDIHIFKWQPEDAKKLVLQVDLNQIKKISQAKEKVKN